MLPSDLEYFRGRVATEKALAKAAENDVAGAVHEELAAKYQRLIDSVESNNLKAASPD